MKAVVMAGGGVRGGQVYGASDKIAAYPISNPVTPQELTATLFHSFGIDLHTTLHDSQDRPYALVEGRPITGLL